jgi:hypothetical protein
MPWRETSPMDQRRLFINARYGISRKTGYKWTARFAGGGYPALADISRRPRSDRLDLPALCPNNCRHLEPNYPQKG